ncbi:MAG: FHA domain-containing protein, partial [Acidobacteria bacterium]|nr:FHA domain-containing protein [Acidobacteriota bacterium]
MAKLTLKFEATVLKEVPIGTAPVIIGRAPDNDIQIDNLAVSTNHAKVFVEEGRLVVEDMGSLNGTFVNNQRVQRTILKTGDTIMIGKHTLIVDDSWDAGPAPTGDQVKKVVAPKVQETMVLDSKKRMEMLQQAAAAAGVKLPGQPAAAPAASGAPSGSTTAASPATPAAVPAAPQARARIASLLVMEGSTDQGEYQLSGKLIIIGKSQMATVKITGFNWFKPKV